VRRTIHLPSLSLISFVVLVCCALNVVAQNREKYVISAKAGGINAVTGQASMHAKGESDWQQLNITDDLQAGDRVRTAFDGRVEILLNPGSYLRLGGNSEVELSNTTLANLEVRLIRGVAIVEATGVEETQMLINISTPHAKLAIDRQGLYRLNVVPNDATELIVRKGRVILGDTNTKIKGGNKVVFSATTVSVAKLTDQEKKLEKNLPLETWSKDRAETLAKANSRISGRAFRTALASMNDPFLFFGGFRRSGFWYYDSRSSCYTFLPYGYVSSPYGSGYSTTIYGGFTPLGGYPGYPSSSGGTRNYPANGPSGNTGTGTYQPSLTPVTGSAPTRTMPTMPASSPGASSAGSSPRNPDTGGAMRPSSTRVP
jgi:hypothetical protein